MRENPIKYDARDSAVQKGRYDSNVSAKKQPQRARDKGELRKSGIIAALCLILPPVGAGLMWATQRFSMRVRAALSVLSAVILFAVAFVFFYNNVGGQAAVVFATGIESIYAPESVTATPTDEPTDTPIPYEYVEAPVQTTDAPSDNANTPMTINDFVPITVTNAPVTDNVFIPAASSGTVYTSDGSLFYHAGTECQGKQYTVALSLDDAKNRGLAPCNNCHPAQ